MSSKELAIQLIEKIPESKRQYIIGILEDSAIPEIETVGPDEWDMAMIAEAERENDGTGITVEYLADELGGEL